MFTNKQLKNMILPLFMEQLLVMLVGIADTFVVSYAGEAAVSIFTTLAVRLVFSYILAIGLHMGVIGIAFAMCMDWTVRGIMMWARFKRGKWKNFQVIR